MNCKYCGGELPEGSQYCGFCQAGQELIVEPAPAEETATWFNDDCGSCANTSCGGHGDTDGALTAVGKDTKYVLFIVGMIGVFIACALAVKFFL